MVVSGAFCGGGAESTASNAPFSFSSAPTNTNNRDHPHFRTGDGDGATLGAPATALEGEADYHQSVDRLSPIVQPLGGAWQ